MKEIKRCPRCGNPAFLKKVFNKCDLGFCVQCVFSECLHSTSTLFCRSLEVEEQTRVKEKIIDIWNRAASTIIEQ